MEKLPSEEVEGKQETDEIVFPLLSTAVNSESVFVRLLGRHPRGGETYLRSNLLRLSAGGCEALTCPFVSYLYPLQSLFLTLSTLKIHHIRNHSHLSLALP